MRSITVTILIALVAQAPAEDSMANVNMDDFADKFVDKLMDHVSGTQLDDADLDKTNLARMPLLSRGVTRFPQPSARSMQTRDVSMNAMKDQLKQAYASLDPKTKAMISQVTKDMSLTSPEKLDVKAMSAAMAMAAGLTPMAANAAMTPSLKNLLNSVVAGGVVLGAIGAALLAVANFDPVDRA